MHSEQPLHYEVVFSSSSSRMRVIYHNWSATKQRPHPQSVAEISRHSVLSGDRIRQGFFMLLPHSLGVNCELPLNPLALAAAEISRGP